LLRAAEVRTLELSENPIGRLTDLDAIAPAIMNLDLNHCELTDISALAQASAPALEALELDYNPLGDAGVVALAEARWLQQLKSLSVVGTKGSPAARQALRSAWGQRPGLTIDADHAK
jgi:Leucine-rich repeat (LRR) protein